jgi:hypothetical protein
LKNEKYTKTSQMDGLLAESRYRLQKVADEVLEMLD